MTAQDSFKSSYLRYTPNEALVADVKWILFRNHYGYGSVGYGSPLDYCRPRGMVARGLL